MKKTLNHFNAEGAAHMVDVAAKPATHRTAIAVGSISMARSTAEIIASGSAKKGDVLGVARVAAIQAAKRASELIPLCHSIRLSGIEVDFDVHVDSKPESSVACRASVHCVEPTGVEIEALFAVQVGLLTIYDMCKAVDRRMRLGDIRLVAKSGGRSGNFESQ